MATITACPACRTVVLPGQQACLRCGTSLDSAPAARICTGCGHRSRDDDRFCAGCGRTLTAPGVPSEPPAAPADTTGVMVGSGTSPRRPLAFLAVLIALVVVVAALQIVEHRHFRPASTVTAFFTALDERDADAAAELLTSIPGTVDRVLLQNPVLRADGYTPPDGVRVEDTDVSGEEATVRVSYRLGGRRHEQTLYLYRDSAATAGVFHRWRLAGGIHSLDVSAPGAESVLIAGAPVTLTPDEYAAASLPAYPGSYEVELPENPLWEAQPVVAEVGTSVDAGLPGAAAELRPAVKASVRTEVDRQIRAYLDDCAGKKTLTPEGCPFSSYSYQQVEGVRWKMTRYPQYELTPAGAGRLTVNTVEYGAAEAGGTVPYSFTAGGYPYADQVTFPINGTVTASAGGVDFEPLTGPMD